MKKWHLWIAAACLPIAFQGCIFSPQPGSDGIEQGKSEKEANARPLAKAGYSFQFARMPGLAKDIGIGANGSIWCIGTYNGQSDNIFRWNGASWDYMNGTGRRIAVGPDGIPWVCQKDYAIYKWNGSGWTRMPGAGRDIAIGGDGSVWVTSEGYNISKWNGSGWTSYPGKAKRIAVEQNGTPWSVNESGKIFRWTGSSWQGMPGEAQDIGIGNDGSIFVTGIEKWLWGFDPTTASVGFFWDYERPIFKWTGSSWQDIGGEAESLSVDPQGNPWVVRYDNGNIYRGY